MTESKWLPPRKCRTCFLSFSIRSEAVPDVTNALSGYLLAASGRLGAALPRANTPREFVARHHVGGRECEDGQRCAMDLVSRERALPDVGIVEGAGGVRQETAS